MIKRTLDDLAVFGGERLYESPRPTGQLYAPDRAKFLARLEQILHRRRYSNGGPMQLELEARLADMHRVGHVVSFANASLALIALLRHCSRDGRPDILLPSFSYRGLPHLIQWAGKRPWFCDVDLSTHTLSAETVERGIGTSRGVAAILAVNHVNAPAHLSELERISRSLDIPLIYDSVYAICAEYGGRPFGGNGKAEVFSLHATKLINGFEGGYVTTNDDALAKALIAIRNFGYEPDRPEISYLGMNGKLNEIHAAMALGSLENASAILQSNEAIFTAYKKSISGIDGLRIIDPAAGMRANHEMVLMHVSPELAIDRDTILKVLQAENALARPYFAPPLHLSKHCPPDVKVGALPNSEHLAGEFIQLPTGAFVHAGDPERLAETLDFITGRGADIAARLGRAAGNEPGDKPGGKQ
ncbi:DegT/DnrJ/EryC1/StrS family aminotransferase [Microbaculum sp. FT89]|uniref:DegT/DnrJ/EryC1/StrS family aminotransferase n=1 Tax=Microbaculum sp. FT89 TaxID=3447298 RepID=UPI003F537519